MTERSRGRAGGRDVPPSSRPKTDKPPRGQEPPLRGPAAPVLGRLFAEKGFDRGAWWPFLVQGEGTDLPGGLEALSGFVLALDGRVFGWWLGWDETAGRHVLDRWWEVDDPAREFSQDEEYHQARQALR